MVKKLSKAHRENIAKALKGRKILWADKIGKSNKGKHNCKGADNPFYGKRHTIASKRKIGIKSAQRKHSPKTKEKISLKMKGRKILWGDKISKTKKGKSNKSAVNKMKKTVKKRWESNDKTAQLIRKKQRLSAIRYISKNKFNNKGLQPRIGRNEKEILDQLEFDLNISIERQFQVDGFFLDGYCKKKNIVFEVDEPHHFKPKFMEKDRLKQLYIKNKLYCTFQRIVA